MKTVLLMAGLLLLAPLAVIAETLPASADANRTILAGDPPPAPELQIPGLLEACGGRWEEIDLALAAGSPPSVGPSLDDAVAAEVRCILETLPRLVESLPYQEMVFPLAVRLVVHACGVPGHPFFAQEMLQQPDARVRSAIQSELLRLGHPAAFREYFRERTEYLEAHQDWDRRNPAAVDLFSSYLEKGTCPEPICSPRLPEALAVIGQNLAVVTLELRGAEEIPNPRNDPTVRGTISRASELRSLAEDFLSRERPFPPTAAANPAD